MSILAIIDMQTGFSAANNADLQEAIVRVIAQYRKYGYPVIMVEYDGFCDTCDLIQDALDGYDKVAKARKNTNDGSIEIISVIYEKGWNSDRDIEVVGVNTGACVRQTAIGLTQEGFNTSLIYGCCGDAYTWGEKADAITPEVSIAEHNRIILSYANRALIA